MSEIERIKALPLAAEVRPPIEDLIEHYTARLRTETPLPPGSDVPARLLPQQADALWHYEQIREATGKGGLCAHLIAGSGKTLLSFLIPQLSNAKRPMLIVPSALAGKNGKEGKTEHEFAELRPYWRAPHITLVKHGEISNDKQNIIFDTYRPDLIVIDEFHRFSNPKAACTRRLFAYLDSEVGQGCELVALSGTPQKLGILDYARIMNRALGVMSPLPRRSGMLYAWAKATESGLLIDHGAVKLGKLERLAHDPSDPDWPRDVVAKRVWASIGCPQSAEPYTGTPLHLHIYRGGYAPAAQAVLDEMRETGRRPDGEDIREGNTIWQHACQLAWGYWAQWDPWPPDDWYEARKEWIQAWTDFRDGSTEWHSEEQIREAALAGHPDVAHLAETARRWLKFKASVKITTRPVWVTKDAPIYDFCREWLDAKGPEMRERSLIWCSRIPAADELGRQLGLPVFGSGQGEAGNPHIEAHNGPAILRLGSNVEGRNLQYKWARFLVTDPPALNNLHEQLIARTHRQRQKADVVEGGYYLAGPEHERSLAAALDNAEHVEQLTQITPRLRWASWTDDEDGERQW